MNVIFRLFEIIRKLRKNTMAITLDVFEGESISFDPSEFIFAGLDALSENIVLVISGRVPVFLPATPTNLAFLKLVLPAVQKSAGTDLKKIDEKIHAATVVADLTGSVKTVKNR